MAGPRDFDKEIKDLFYKWNRICESNKLRDNTKDYTTGKYSKRYQIEVDLAYYIDSITRGPIYFQSKNLDQAHQLIDNLRESTRR